MNNIITISIIISVKRGIRESYIIIFIKCFKDLKGEMGNPIYYFHKNV